MMPPELSKVGVSLDFFGTLVEIDEDVPTVALALTEMGLPCTPEVEAIWNSTGFDGQHTHDPESESYDSWRRAGLKALVELCGSPTSGSSAIADRLLELDRKWTVRRRPGADRLLDAIDYLGAQRCILSNWDYAIEPYLEMAGLPVLPALTSAAIGARKPAVYAFQRARELLGVAPNEHIHVGDDWNADVVGSIRSGAWALWITEDEAAFLPRRIVRCRMGEAPEALVRLVAHVSGLE
jgi:FMN phosphatase YigB (HAD superfamily)